MSQRSRRPRRRIDLRPILLGSLALFAVLFVVLAVQLVDSGVGNAEAERAQALETSVDPRGSSSTAEAGAAAEAAEAEEAEAAAEAEEAMVAEPVEPEVFEPVEPVITQSS
jgi:hypothetical protein